MFSIGFKLQKNKCTLKKKTITRINREHEDVSFQKGSITVEAAMVMPLFLFVVLGFLYMMEVIGLIFHVQMTLNDTARQLSTLSYYEENVCEPVAIQTDFAVNLGTEYIGKSCVYQGVISLMNSEKKDEDLILSADYIIRIPVPFWDIKWMTMHQTVRTRSFVGKTIKDDIKEGEKEKRYVYITENGTVYHESLECSHLKRTLQVVSPGELAIKRNDNGACYYPCEYCGDVISDTDTYYITPDGTRYHSKIDCSGLKRTIQKVEYETVKDWRGCSRCSMGG